MLHHTFLSPRQEGNTIRLHDDEEVISWCQLFACTPTELHQAVAAVGPDFVTVYEHLQSMR